MENKKDIIVYFAGAIRGDRTMAGIIKEIVSYIKGFGFPLLTEHVGADDPIANFAKKIGKTKENLTAEDIEKQDMQWLDQATHVIAEISGASTGTGREIEYARNKGRLGKVAAKILCLYQTEREFYASPMIRGMDKKRYPEMTIKSYRDIAEAKIIIEKFLLAQK
jgi:nucleoside 2-deoxyribosyltransferase